MEAVKIIEICKVAPPSSLPSTTLPLTFFDIPWFFISHPIQRIFFYDFPYPTHHFLQTTLPTLKHSLSLTLQHFFPFASNITVPPQRRHSSIRYLNGHDSVPFTVAEYSKAEHFTTLTSNSPQDIRNLHPLLPTLPPPRVEKDGTRVLPIMAIQVTILPNSGFTLGLTYNHVVADGKSLHHFIKHWACVCKEKRDAFSSIKGSYLSLPSHERHNVKDPNELKLLYLQVLERLESQQKTSCPSRAAAYLASDTPNKDFLHTQYLKSEILPKQYQNTSHLDQPSIVEKDVFTTNNKVRSTIVLTGEQVEKLKKYVALKCTDSGTTSHISTFVVTCSLIWVCLLKSEQGKGKCIDGEQLCYFGFVADSRDQFSLPSTYFGNCLVSCYVKVKRGVVVGENGMVEVAFAIERKVRDFKGSGGALREAEKPISEFMEPWKPGNSLLTVAGSPNLAVYKTDFGWGNPRKSEAVHIDAGSISLSDCRYQNGAIEVGLVLERIQMNNFINILQHQLKILVSD
ncbi:hypothetical protein RJT34_17180 [Clitoria ternatea]|uniref:Uncharacterized protein n=1 Tax=Clitoria ternatea TaxID=43366 RepID=A0AAN9J8U6_CLITE